MWQQPKFDEHQFVRRGKMVSSESRLAFADIKNMHICKSKVKQERRLATPEWAMHDTLLRSRVLDYLERRFYLKRNEGLSDADRLARVDAESKRRLPAMRQRLNSMQKRYHEDSKASVAADAAYLRRLSIEVQNKDTEIVMIQRGISAIVFSAVYKYYRLGWNSSQIANDLQLRPPMIRIWLYRLNRLYSMTYRPRRVSLWPAERLKKMFMLRASGLSWKACAAQLSCCTHSAIDQWNVAFGRLRAGKVERSGRPKKWDADTMREVYELLDLGWNRRLVALQMKYPYHQLAWAIRTHPRA
jgi:hypothetical protein